MRCTAPDPLILDDKVDDEFLGVPDFSQWSPSKLPVSDPAEEVIPRAPAEEVTCTPSFVDCSPVPEKKKSKFYFKFFLIYWYLLLMFFFAF